jgi:hypothetical protein
VVHRGIVLCSYVCCALVIASFALACALLIYGLGLGYLARYSRGVG